ncbi:hypothetical protein D3C83_82380 [compost metagenome]
MVAGAGADGLAELDRDALVAAARRGAQRHQVGAGELLEHGPDLPDVDLQDAGELLLGGRAALLAVPLLAGALDLAAGPADRA